MLVSVSTNSTSNYLVQIGDAGGIETTGYVSASQTDSASRVTSTAGFIITSSIAAAGLHSGRVELELEDASDFTWVGVSDLTSDGGVAQHGQGYKSLSAVLTQLRITSVTPDTFDSGAINISYER